MSATTELKDAYSDVAYHLAQIEESLDEILREVERQHDDDGHPGAASTCRIGACLIGEAGGLGALDEVHHYRRQYEEWAQ